MKTPATIKIGRRRYKVIKKRHMHYAGLLSYRTKELALATHWRGTVPYTPRQIKETFWHEVIHGILYDMRQYALNSKEKFVDGLAMRIVAVLKQLPKDSR